MRRFLLLLLAVSLASFACAPAQPPAEAPPAEAQPTEDATLLARLEILMPELLDEYRVPGAAVALLENGKVVWAQGFGYADMANKKAVDEATGFNIGSISKTVAAWGVMKLVEDGRLDLDTPVESYLTRWHLPPSEFDVAGVTLRRLLSHTAGLSLHGYPGFGPDDELPTVEQSLSGMTNGSDDVRLIMEPGTEWKYSGGGYTIAQLLIEEITGQNFDDYMQEQVLTPLDMQGSSYRISPEIVAASSLAYDAGGEETPNPLFTARAAAGLHTTIADFARFAAANLRHGDDESPGRGVLRPETLELMMTPAEASNDEYGLGYSIEQLPDGRAAHGHGGANRGWHAQLFVVPEDGDGLVVVTNGSNGWAIHAQVACAWSAPRDEEATENCRRPLFPILHRIYQAEGPDQALARFDELYASDEKMYILNVNPLFALGYRVLEGGDVDAALRVFKRNYELHPEHTGVAGSLGEAYWKAGQREKGIELLERAVELDPTNSHRADMLEEFRREIANADA